MNKELEELLIYQQYMDLIFYVELITKKFPKREQSSLVNKIRAITYDGMEYVIDSYKEYKYTEKLSFLSKVDSKLKLLKVLVRLSYKNNYISSNNYKSWSKKITNVGNSLGSWMKSCQKQLKNRSMKS